MEGGFIITTLIELLFREHEGNRAVRSGNWKIVSSYPEAWELYDIAADRVERHNVSAQHPNIVKRLSDEWDAWATRTNVDPWPGPARLPWGDNAPGRGGTNRGGTPLQVIEFSK